MANALKFHAVVSGKRLTLADLGAFEGKRVEVIVMEDEEANVSRSDETEGRGTSEEPQGLFGCFSHLKWSVPEDFDAPNREVLDLFEG